MPELPEVEDFRQLLLPLMNNKKKNYLHLERCNLDKKPPRKFITDDEINYINQHQFVVVDVLRRGKLICMVLTTPSSIKKNYLYVHMGMTGRISTSNKLVVGWRIFLLSKTQPLCRFRCCCFAFVSPPKIWGIWAV